MPCVSLLWMQLGTREVHGTHTHTHTHDCSVHVGWLTDSGIKKHVFACSMQGPVLRDACVAWLMYCMGCGCCMDVQDGLSEAQSDYGRGSCQLVQRHAA